MTYYFNTHHHITIFYVPLVWYVCDSELEKFKATTIEFIEISSTAQAAYVFMCDILLIKPRETLQPEMYLQKYNDVFIGS